MRQPLNFIRLPSMEKWLTLEASLLLIAYRLGLRLVPFRTLNRTLNQARGKRAGPLPDPSEQKLIVRAVNRASRYIPGESTCLPRAMAAQKLLLQRGFPSNLRLGVLKQENNILHAHAWVECEGQVLIGGTVEEIQRFTTLPIIEDIYN